jgi:hypothetical protein
LDPTRANGALPPLVKAIYALDAFENVMDIKPVAPHKGIAS